MPLDVVCLWFGAAMLAALMAGLAVPQRRRASILIRRGTPRRPAGR